MKQLVPLILFVLLATSALADSFTTTINVTTQNNIATVGTEQWTTNYVCNLNSSDNRTLTISRDIPQNNLSVALSQNLTVAIQKITDAAENINSSRQDTTLYAPLYTACFANLTMCRAEEGIIRTDLNNKTGIESRYNDCADKLSTCEADRATLNVNKATCDDDLKEMTTSKENAEQNGWIKGIVGLALGALGYWFIFVKSKFGSHERQQQQPPVDKGGMMSQ